MDRLSLLVWNKYGKLKENQDNFWAVVRNERSCQAEIMFGAAIGQVLVLSHRPANNILDCFCDFPSLTQSARLKDLAAVRA